MITIGTDVEMFLESGGKFVSAHELLPGTKKEPYPVNGGYVQVDGVAAELNTPPTTTFEEFKESLYTVVDAMKTLVPNHGILPDVTVPVDVLVLPPDVKRLSCESDFDPYMGDLNPTLDEDTPYRSAGGHIHVGGIFPEGMSPRQQWKKATRLSRLMDKYVGVYSVMWDRDDYRRSTYGRAGACRVKEYGVEYRSLSNAWMFNERVMEFVFAQTLKATEALERGEDVNSTYATIINNSLGDHEFFSLDSTAAELRRML